MKAQHRGRKDGLKKDGKTQSRNPSRALAAAPSAGYLKMVERRHRAVADAFNGELQKPHVNLPGLAFGTQDGIGLFKQMVSILHWQNGAIRKALLPGIRSAWELVEFEELLAIGDDVVGDDKVSLPASGKEAFHWRIRGSFGLNADVQWTLSETAMFCAFTLHWHAAAISERVLPKAHLADAVALAEALVIAECFACLDEKFASSVAAPTSLQKQAWELAARLWLEWPKEKEFCELPKPSAGDFISRIVGVPAGGEQVAP